MTTKEYFYALNYTLANEDTEFEYQLTRKLKPKKIISVCGAGSRCFPLLNDEAQELILVDLSKEQLKLAQLRAETIKQFNYDEFILFWGYPPFRPNENHQKRKELFLSLDLNLELTNFFKNLFEYQNWESILYIGKWEKTFSFFSKIVTKVLSEKTRDELFSFDNISEQRNYVKTKFPRLKWKLIMSILGNKALFNALLYKGDFIKKNVDETYIQYYDKAFNHLMEHDLVKKSYFMQLCYYGSIVHPAGNLLEGKEKTFKEMKKHLKRVKIQYLEKDIISAIAGENAVDFVSLSDVPSYFSGELEQNFFQMIKTGLAKDAIVINRNYLRIPNSDRSGYKDISLDFKKELDNEKVQMYRIEVLKNES
jgi:S-adenosylmethionine-diacylglycerol 3-amino-3-carboxypropyl transferase